MYGWHCMIHVGLKVHATRILGFWDKVVVHETVHVALPAVYACSRIRGTGDCAARAL